MWNDTEYYWISLKTVKLTNGIQKFSHSILGIFSSVQQSSAIKCPDPQKYGHGPIKPCVEPTDPNKRPPSGIETWFTESVFNDLFPKSNLGWGPDKCSPYNYEAFIIAARYFPKFGNECVTKNPNGTKLNTDYTANETFRRDVSAFFAHAVQETGENDAHLYDKLPKDQAADCFYRGGFYNWFEGGPVSSLVQNQGANVEDGVHCIFNALYCNHFFNNTYFYPCNSHKEGNWYKVLLSCSIDSFSFQSSKIRLINYISYLFPIRSSLSLTCLSYSLHTI